MLKKEWPIPIFYQVCCQPNKSDLHVLHEKTSWSWTYDHLYLTSLCKPLRIYQSPISTDVRFKVMTAKTGSWIDSYFSSSFGQLPLSSRESTRPRLTPEPPLSSTRPRLPSRPSQPPPSNLAPKSWLVRCRSSPAVGPICRVTSTTSSRLHLTAELRRPICRHHQRLRQLRAASFNYLPVRK